MRTPHALRALLIAAIAFLSSHAVAGGPFVVDENGTGVAAKWLNDTVTWYSETGSLPGFGDNAAALQMVQEQFDKWQKAKLDGGDGTLVETANVKSVRSDLGFDVNAENFREHCYSSKATKTCVIFDSDGSITDELMGTDSKETIIGLSQPERFTIESGGVYITKGIIILNGYLSGKVDQEQFKAAVLHEIGHLLNLDHTQINLDIGTSSDCTLENNCGDEGRFVPTMYPELVSDRQGTLSYDDRITISWLYPKVENASDKFYPGFATITGEIFDRDGNPMQGVNVVAMREGEGDEMARIDARSMISGALYPAYTENGRYYLYGLVPGKKYKVVAEPVYHLFTGPSGFEPIENPPQNFEETVIKTPDDDEFVVAPGAGESLEMASLTLDVENPCVEANACPSGYSGSSTSTKKLCNMVPGGAFDAASAMWPLAALLSAGIIALRRKTR